MKKASDAFLQRRLNTPNLRKLVYGEALAAEEGSEDEEEVGGLFHVATKEGGSSRRGRATINGLDCTRQPASASAAAARDWDSDAVRTMPARGRRRRRKVACVAM
ncbi:PREDICTED: ribosome biogenesis protein BMS1 homolog [Priapulus caudatus]|uniref:Ribosome biogenesis protein BMS1 homolog n=1 Tax=Priapulus caudatus TaxID=37621 RepID=A0ABM1F1Q4_PRICU|nr:PREDICTED: ribosome biogenesis protein BMS1 homolog [Priapulus caudatus]